MKQITKPMEKALLEVYRKKTAKGINKGTLKALYVRGLVDDLNIITSLGMRYAISKLPLYKQCDELGLKLEKLKLGYSDRPESAVLEHYRKLGYTGVSCEGIGILTILKALMLDKLAELNPFNDRDDSCTRNLEAQFTILEYKTNEIIPTIKTTTRDTFISNFREIIEKPFISLEYPELSIDFASALFDATDKKTFVNVANKIAEDPYTYRNGWPDLTLIKGAEVLFVEVKTTDKLHESQLITIPVMRSIFQFNFMVCKVTK